MPLFNVFLALDDQREKPNMVLSRPVITMTDAIFERSSKGEFLVSENSLK